MKNKYCVLILAALLSGCFGPPYPRGEIDTLYPQPPRPQLRQVQAGGRSLQIAVMAGTAGATPVFFVHGSPGDWKAWAHYLNDPALAGYGNRYAFDRPGYGGSGAGEMIPDLQAQADVLAAAIKTLEPGQRAIVVGHSLGGPLIGWLTLAHAELVCGGVMIAGSVAPDLEAPRWYNHFASSTIGSWITPSEMLWSNVEITSLQGELRKLDAAWPGLQRPLVAIQGDKDDLVDPRTADHLQQLAPSNWLRVIRVPDQGHFVLWQRPDIVEGAIRSLGCGPG